MKKKEIMDIILETYAAFSTTVMRIVLLDEVISKRRVCSFVLFSVAGNKKFILLVNKSNLDQKHNGNLKKGHIISIIVKMPSV